MANYNKSFKLAVLTGCVAAALGTLPANASHFRGAVLVPSIDANGLLTITSKSFWRRSVGTAVPTFPHSGTGTISVTGAGSVSPDSSTQDITDIRRAQVDQVYTVQLSGAGSYTMSWGSGSWVSGVPNASGNYGTSSTIVWDGSSATTPISFDLENIQQQVIRNVAYSDNLDAVGTGLTYNDTNLATGMTSQATGYSISASGQIEMSAATTNAIGDNMSNPGADIAYSGRISSADGSAVNFVWVFDAVDVGNNLAPEIQDVVINALVGDNIAHTLVVTDPNGDPVTTGFISFVGSSAPALPISFNPMTLEFTWDSTGSAVGTYIATFGASDGQLSDQGTITINLTTGGGPRPTTVPVPATLLLMGTGLILLSGRRRRKAK